MAKASEPKIGGKQILLIAAVVILVALAIWQGTKSISPTASDPSFSTAKPPPPESARPPGFPSGAPPEKDEKLGKD